ncbi:LOW QUALITY PROTEIN: hypothetical protein HID58_016702, partial [Brassica napus]
FFVITTQTISKNNFFVATHPIMANSFIILAEFKNIDQSLQVLEDQRIDLLVISMLTYNIVDGTIYQAPQLCSVFAARVVFDAKNQNKHSETKPPMVHNLSHHFSSELNSIYVEEVKSSLSNAFLQADIALAEDRNRGSFLRLFFWYLGSCCPYFWKVCFLMIVVLFLHLNLMVAKAADGRAILCRNGEAIDMSRDHKPIYLPKSKEVAASTMPRLGHVTTTRVTISTLSRARRSKDTFNRGRQVSNDGMRGDLGRFDNSKGFCIVRFELHRSRSDNACLRSLRLNKLDNLTVSNGRSSGGGSTGERVCCFCVPVSVFPTGLELRRCISSSDERPALLLGSGGFHSTVFAGFCLREVMVFSTSLSPALFRGSPDISICDSGLICFLPLMSVVPCKYVGGLKIDCRRLNSSSIRRSATSDFAARALALTVLVE